MKKWHELIMWPALLAVVIYAVSALTHPLMAWTGPQAKKMFPPKIELQGDITLNIKSIADLNNLEQAKIAKLIPYQDQVLLQITEHELQPRRYFSIDSNKEIANHDSVQATWLAHYYLGDNPVVKQIDFKTHFDQEYSKVNRLLPVYKITFDTQDNLSVFIHTETMALAGINNDWKRTLKFIFKNLHSFDWLNEFEVIRLLLVTILVSIITIMALTGLGFIILINRKKKPKRISRRWHRRLAYIVTLPLILFSISGIYHLLYSSIATHEYGMRLTQELNLKTWPNLSLEKDFKNIHINQINLVNIQDNPTTHEDTNTTVSSYRVSGRKQHIDNINTREKRFKGMAKETTAFYLDKDSTILNQYSDKKLIQLQAESLLNTKDINMKLVTHFGPDYDFRNKRLPVWKISDTRGNQIFIDPATHILVDQSNMTARLERYSFSFLHKWNMLSPLTGRFNRDVLMIIILLMTLTLSIFGYLIHRKQARD